MMATPATAPIAIPALAPPLRPEEGGIWDGRAPLLPVWAAPAVAAVAVEDVVAGADVLDVDDDDVDVVDCVALLITI